MTCKCHSHNGFVLGRSPEGLAQRELERAGDLTRSDKGVSLDMVGSVSALVDVEGSHVFDDQLLDNQYRRFHNGF